jgi:TonB family protein
MEASMTEAWQQLQGQVVNEEFPLREYLGAAGQDSSSGGVFLTEISAPEPGQAAQSAAPQRAAIKLFPLQEIQNQRTAEQQLSLWRQAANFSDVHILPIFRAGRCQLNGVDYLYLVMEYAEENLGQILPQRALSAEETREMFGPVLDGLAYLHDQGFAHTRLKPSNILAVSDQLKLSSDGILPLGEPSRSAENPDAFVPPETGRGWISEASDVWSLGVTLVEALTQQPPVWSEAEHWEPALPEGMPAPFLEIARGCLRRDPNTRLTINEIAAQLGHPLQRKVAAPVVPKAETPAPAPYIKEPHIKAPAIETQPARMEAAADAAVASAPVRPRAAETRQRKREPRKWGWLVPVLGALALAVVLIPRFINRSAAPQESATSAPESATPAATTDGPGQPGVVPPVSQTPAGQKQAPQQNSTINKNLQTAKAAPPAPVRSGNANPEEITPTSAPVPSEVQTPRASGGAVSAGGVLEQVLPDVPQRSRETIRGTLKLSVRVHVDATGQVTSAELADPGPSQYFARLALDAARRWKFNAGQVAGHGAASDWILHFEFTHERTRATPTQEPF